MKTHTSLSNISLPNENYERYLGPFIQQHQLLTQDPLPQTLNALLEKIERDQSPVKKSVYISYAWSTENRPYEKWTQVFVVELRQHLCKAGITAHVDWIDSRYGNNSKQFMRTLPDHDFVILIGTESLKEKDNGSGINAVCLELNLCDIKRKEDAKLNRNAIIPIILSGTFDDAMPVEFRKYTVIEEFAAHGYLAILKDLIRRINTINEHDGAYHRLWKPIEHSHSNFFQPLASDQIKYYLQDSTYSAYLTGIFTSTQAASVCDLSPRTRFHFFSQGKPQPQLIYKSACCNLPRQNLNFSGRAQELQLIENYLEETTQCSVISTLKLQGIRGLGGLGKTQLALAYAHHKKDTYYIVWWIDASSPIKEQLSSLAEKLGIPKNDEHIKEKLRDTLAERENWLIIFDNVKETKVYHELITLLPNTSQKSRQHILCTSRIRGKGHNLELGLLPEQEALTLIKHMLERPFDKNQCKRLIAVISTYPLVLIQAISYLNNTPTQTIEDYIHLYTARHAKLKQREAQQPIDDPELFSGYIYSVEAALEMSLEEMWKSSPKHLALCQEILYVIALLHSQDIPLALLKKCSSTFCEKLGLDSDFESDHVISKLVNYYFLYQETSTNSTTGQSHEKYSIHDVPHKYAYDLLIAKKSTPEIHSLLETIFDACNKSHVWRTFTLFDPHLQSLRNYAVIFRMQSFLKHKIELEIINNNPTLSDHYHNINTIFRLALEDLGKYYYDLGELENALNCYQTIYAYHNTAREIFRDSVDITITLVEILQKMNNVESSQRFYEEALGNFLSLCEKNKNPWNDEYWTNQLQKFIVLYDKQFLNSSIPNLKVRLSSLALRAQHTTRDRAMSFYRTVSPFFISHIGSCFESYTLLYRLGSYYYPYEPLHTIRFIEQEYPKDHDNAIIYIGHALDVLVKINTDGKHHETLGKTASHLAECCYDKGNICQATAYLRQGIQSIQQISNRSNELNCHLAYAHFLLGKCYLKSGDEDPAVAAYTQAQTIFKELKLSEYKWHIYFFYTNSTLGSLYEKQVEPHKALECYAMAIQSLTHGLNSSNITQKASQLLKKNMKTLEEHIRNLQPRLIYKR